MFADHHSAVEEEDGAEMQNQAILEVDQLQPFDAHPLQHGSSSQLFGVDSCRPQRPRPKAQGTSRGEAAFRRALQAGTESVVLPKVEVLNKFGVGFSKEKIFWGKQCPSFDFDYRKCFRFFSYLFISFK